jgi:hypothetical protein
VPVGVISVATFSQEAKPESHDAVVTPFSPEAQSSRLAHDVVLKLRREKKQLAKPEVAQHHVPIKLALTRYLTDHIVRQANVAIDVQVVVPAAKNPNKHRDGGGTVQTRLAVNQHGFAAVEGAIHVHRQPMNMTGKFFRAEAMVVGKRARVHHQSEGIQRA